MKKNPLILVLFIFLSINVFGQKKYHFKQEYFPNSEYEMDMLTFTDGDMNFTVKDSAVSVQMKMEMKMGYNITTQKAYQNKVPFSMRYSDIEMKMNVEGKEISMNKENLLEIELVGEIEDGNKMKIDEIKGSMSNDIKQILNKNISQFSQYAVDFPKEGMEIGDSFALKIPYSTKTLQGIDVKMNMQIIYKLISVKEDIAYFDTQVEATMDGDMEQNQFLSMVMSGGGTSEFDIKQSQFSKFDSDIDLIMDMKMKEGEMKMHFKVKSNLVQKKIK